MRSDKRNFIKEPVKALLTKGLFMFNLILDFLGVTFNKMSYEIPQPVASKYIIVKGR